MRRRAALLALPIGVSALAACTPSQEPAAPIAEGGPAREPGRDPVLLGEMAETVDVSAMRLPVEMTVQVVVRTGWSAPPQQLGGTFLGRSDVEGVVRYSVMSEDGTVQWTIERPAAADDAVLSPRAEGAAVLVLPDLEVTGDAPRRSVSAFALVGADRLWGPIDVPGPRVAPGLVHAPQGDPAGERIALSPATGEVALTEADLQGGRILAAVSGVLVTIQRDSLVALTSDASEEAWRAELPEGVSATEARIDLAADPGGHLATIRTEDSAGALLDLRDGSVIASSVRQAAVDTATQTVVVVSGPEIRGLDLSGAPQWVHSDPEELILVSAGERLGYGLRPTERSLAALDMSTGTLVNPFDADLDGPLAVPEVFTPEGSACVRIGAERLLVTSELDLEYGS